MSTATRTHRSLVMRWVVVALAVSALMLGVVATAGARMIGEAESGSVTAVGGSISGTVTDQDTGLPLEGVSVSVSAASGGSGSDTTDALGQYEIMYLPSGDYIVAFSKLYYQDEWYDESSTWLGHTKVPQDGSEFVTGIDGSLSPLPTAITGTVEDADTGALLEGVNVTPYYHNGSDWVTEGDSDLTDASGEFELVILRGADTYRLKYDAPGNWYRVQYYEQVTDIGDGTDVVFDGTTTVDVGPEPLTPIPDDEAPAASDDVSSPYDNQAVISIEATDTETDHFVSGLKSISYAFNGEATQTVASNEVTAAVGYSGSLQSVKYFATDNAGNKSGVVSRSFRVNDTLSPTTSDDAVSSYTSAASISIDATDTGSGVLHIEYKLDGDATQTVTAENAVVAAGVGTHTLTYRAVDMIPNFSTAVTRHFTVYEDTSPAVPERVSDRDRFSTAVEIAKEGFPSWTNVSDVIIASGDDRAAADPLAAAGLCWAHDAPLFLVSANSTPNSVKTAIKQITDANGAITIHVVGGPVSVPEARINEIKSAAGAGNVTAVDRLLSTGGRFEMSAEIAARVTAEWTSRYPGTKPDAVLVANGADSTKFFDALALSPISAANGYPVLLVSADSVPNATRAAITAIAPADVIVGGGPATVSEAVRVSLGGERWSGTTRYTTAIEIANKADGRGWIDCAKTGVAAKLPDALTGGSMVGLQGGPLVVTDGQSLTPQVATWLTSHKSEIRECYVFGGPVSMTDKVKGQIADCLD